MKVKAEEACARLQADIASIKAQKVALMRAMERSGREHVDAARERDREVAALRKAGRANAAALQRVEALAAKQQVSYCLTT